MFLTYRSAVHHSKDRVTDGKEVHPVSFFIDVIIARDDPSRRSSPTYRAWPVVIFTFSFSSPGISKILIKLIILVVPSHRCVLEINTQYFPEWKKKEKRKKNQKSKISIL